MNQHESIFSGSTSSRSAIVRKVSPRSFPLSSRRILPSGLALPPTKRDGHCANCLGQEDLNHAIQTPWKERSASFRVVPRHDDLRRRLRLGLAQGGKPQGLRRLSGSRRQLHRHGQLLHQRHQRVVPRRIHAGPSGAAGLGDQVHPQPSRQRSQRCGQSAEEHGAGRRGQPEAAPNRLHRSLLAAHLGSTHPHRGSDAGLRRSRASGQDPLCGSLRHARLGRRQSQHAGGTAGLDAVCRDCRSSTA